MYGLFQQMFVGEERMTSLTECLREGLILGSFINHRNGNKNII